jgi:nucleoside-diphosphate kinase
VRQRCPASWVGLTTSRRHAQIDIKNRKTFLKKTKVELTLKQLFIGATVTVFSRLLKIIDYGDEFTRSQIAPQSERWARGGSTMLPCTMQPCVCAHAPCYAASTPEHVPWVSRVRSTLAMIKPDAYAHLGKILNAVSDARLRVNKLRVSQITRAQAEAFYAVHAGKPFFEKLVDFMSSGRIAAMELVGEGAIARVRRGVGEKTGSRGTRQATRTGL